MEADSCCQGSTWSLCKTMNERIVNATSDLSCDDQADTELSQDSLTLLAECPQVSLSHTLPDSSLVVQAYRC